MDYWIQFRRIDDAHEIRSRRNSGWPDDRHAGTVDMVTDNNHHGRGCMELLALSTPLASFSLASIHALADSACLLRPSVHVKCKMSLTIIAGSGPREHCDCRGGYKKNTLQDVNRVDQRAVARRIVCNNDASALHVPACIAS